MTPLRWLSQIKPHPPSLWDGFRITKWGHYTASQVGRTRDHFLPCCKDLDRALAAANRQPQISCVQNSVTNQPGNSSWAGWQWPQHCHTHSYLLNCFVVTSRHVLDHTFTNISLLLSKEMTAGLRNIRGLFKIIIYNFYFFICRCSPFLFIGTQLKS